MRYPQAASRGLVGNGREAFTGGMPKSRGRNGRRNRPSKKNRNAHLHAGAKQRAELAPYVAALEAANEREAAGDADGAIDVILTTPCGPDGALMWASWRMDRLIQLSFAAPVLSRWAHARWMVAQSVIQLNRPAVERSNRAVAMAVEAQGESPITKLLDRQVWINDHDWMVHQLAVHDLGGLAAFLASKPAVANLAGEVSSWADAPMGGYRLEREIDHEIVWTDLASGEEVTTINIGTAARTYGSSGRCVIGRVVECDGVRLFSIPPAGVSEELARAVAVNPPEWLAAVKESGEAFVLTALSRGQDAPLFTDVFDTEWSDELIDPFDLEHWGCDDGMELEPTPEEIDALAADAILGHLRRRDRSPWINPPQVGAALLCLGVWTEVVSRVGPEHAQGLADLSGRLVGPPADMCRQLGASLRQSA